MLTSYARLYSKLGLLQGACVLALLSCLPAFAQVINCTSGFNTTTTANGACGVSVNGTSADFWISGHPTTILSGTSVILSPVAAGHAGNAFNKQVVENEQAFATTFRFTVNAENIAFVLQNNPNVGDFPAPGPIFTGGAGDEGGFAQFAGGSNTPPAKIFALMFDNVGANSTASGFTYSNVQIYQSLIWPGNPEQGGSDYLAQYITNKYSTSPVPLNSPPGSIGSPSNDVFQATITYDGSSVVVTLFDITAGGTCTPVTSGTCFTHTWTNVDIPSIVGANTAYPGIVSGTSSTEVNQQLISYWTYAVNTPTATPTTVAWNANSTYISGGGTGAATSAASPVFSVAPGTYSTTQSVAMTTSTTPNNYICYTLSAGTPAFYPQPDNNGGCVEGTLYSAAVSIPSTSTLYAMAASSNQAFGIANNNPAGLGPPSQMTAGTYTISSTPTVAAPTFSVAAGSYTAAQTFTISTATSGATICYTTNGTTPAASTAGTCSVGTSVASGSSVTVAASTPTTVQAIGTLSGDTNSSVTSAAYTILTGTVGTPAASPAAGTYTGTQTVTLASPTSGSVPTGTMYFISPSGNDSNSGLTSSLPWLTPNHALNCGDMVMAATGTYAASNFTTGKWGTVTCSSTVPSVAWLKCTTFDGCKISAASTNAIMVSASYWGVQGWEASTTTSGGCFVAQPPTSSVSLRYVIFANDVANGCAGNGFNTAQNGTVGVDYLAYVGNISYGTATTTTECDSGISVYEPRQYDTVLGTHIYVAGNIIWDSVDGACNGGSPTDGEGILFDTFDGSQTGGYTPYTQQAVMTNNIALANGNSGIKVYENNTGTAPFSNIYMTQNTTYGNTVATNESSSECSETQINEATSVNMYGNLAVASTSTSCGGNPLYAYYVVLSPSGTNQVNANYGYSPGGNNQIVAGGSTGFAFGTNTYANPAFVGTTIPGAPSCGSATSVPNCAATTISNFTPTTAGSTTYGRQVPSTTPVDDPLYPQWLCNVALPAGLLTPGCKANLYYTTDGSTPTTSSAVYTTPLTVSSTQTIKSLATKMNYTNSSVGTAAYTINGAVTVSTPTFSPIAGTYTSAQTVSITSSTSGATICYTTNGTTPAATTAGTCSTGTTLANGGTISVGTSETVMAIGTLSGDTNSSVASAAYVINLSTATPCIVAGGSSLTGLAAVR